MKNDNKVVEKVFEILLNEAALLADEHIEENLYVSEDDIEFSKEHENKMKKIFKNERRKIFLKKFYKYSKRVACVFIVFIIISGITVFSVNAWRIKFLNYVLEIGKPNTDYEFGDTQGGFYSNDDILFEYIPKGFELTKNLSNESSIYLKFKNDNLYFTLTLNNIDGKSSIDTENGLVQNLNINRCEAFYSTNNNINALIWHNDKFSFKIIGNISKDEIIRIAENIKK